MAEVEVGTNLSPQEEAPVDDVKAALVNGTVLEAAFVHPDHTWPPADGQGKNAIELEASKNLLKDNAADDDDATTDGEREAMQMPKKPVGMRKGLFGLCRSSDLHVVGEYEQKKVAVNKARSDYKTKKKNKEKEQRKKHRYEKVPEGIMIYRLDTANHTIQLMSQPTNEQDQRVVETIVVAASKPSNDSSRRGIEVTGIDGKTLSMVACEQRTAIAWCEAMDMMLANDDRAANATNGKRVLATQASRAWGNEELNVTERDQIEEQYLNLAAYSNKLIRAGALPGQKNKGGGAGGIYYSVDFQSDKGEDYEEEALESIAKRRAVIKDSWDFYRMICSLLRDRRKYDEVFRKMQLDAVYPYLNSMTGLNDPGDNGTDASNKMVIQKEGSGFNKMSKTQIADAMVKKAEEALPSLVEICKALAGSLGMEEVGVGPIKEPQAAIRKADKKYEGDLLMVTDYCRALLVVKDFPSLLALLELARDSFGPLIRRVKLSALKSDHKSLQGGYRDCKINLELKGHICEIQVHVWPMWTVCGVDGFRHYRHCLEYSTDSFADPYDALEGLDRKTMAELIVMAEEAVADTPLDNLEWYQEKFILDYFAEVGLFMKHGLDEWAEVTLRTLVKLRCESPDIGPEHHETFILQQYLEKVLRRLKKTKEADEVLKKITKTEQRVKKETKEAESSLWDQVFVAPNDAYDMVMDPNKKEREEEENMRKEVKASKKQWRKIRQERFGFLDSAQQSTTRSQAAETTVAGSK
eukprot:CAMPEP_0119015918 /NCGR_PEP_ID=MMETSP1176-20130426/11720_1 /TAXON_ID=265551 /ORGANISM="Synedropsis recta cf, Strain CCMP1620" /LENGTH=751 /DNA_ID=CAMNT_0006969243 /DNA_START=15 /DNA_END=2270 /DNA_ORIENTATION=-